MRSIRLGYNDRFSFVCQLQMFAIVDPVFRPIVNREDYTIFWLSGFLGDAKDLKFNLNFAETAHCINEQWTVSVYFHRKLIKMCTAHKCSITMRFRFWSKETNTNLINGTVKTLHLNRSNANSATHLFSIFLVRIVPFICIQFYFLSNVHQFAPNLQLSNVDRTQLKNF